MSVASAGRAPAVARASRRRPGVGAVYRVELAKISVQFLPRLTAAVCLIGPFVFALILKTQSSVPADTLFGRWIHTSGFAIPLVVLGFSGVAGFPVLASIVAGDIFAGEDRLATWKTTLTRSCSRDAIFAGKTLAAATFTIAIVALLAVSSTVAGAVVVGTEPLISLSGTVLSPSHTVVLILESFGVALIPTLAFTCMAILFSVASRNSMVGVLGPPLIGLAMVLLSLMGSGLVVRTILLSTPFEAWHGLLVVPRQVEPLLLGFAVSAVYAYLCLSAARTMIRRRDFAGESGMTVGWPRIARGLVVVVAILGVLAVGAAFDRTWITSQRVEDSVAGTFKNLVVVQQTMLGHADKARSFGVSPFCARGGALTGASSGAGDDWVCQLNVNGSGLGQLGVSYTVNVRPNGCYTAEGPPSVTGPLHIRGADGRVAVNPLFAFDGCMIAP